jgi:hypothetical protein
MKNNSRYSHLTKDEALKEILANTGLLGETYENRILESMGEAFREGWLRGEEYGYEMYSPSARLQPEKSLETSCSSCGSHNCDECVVNGGTDDNYDPIIPYEHQS